MTMKFCHNNPRMALRSAIRIFLFFLSSLMSMSSFAQWQSFKWVEFEQNAMLIKKSAIHLPVKLDGIYCDMQLDTGAGISILYRNALPSRYSRLLKPETLLIEQFTLTSEISPKTFQLMYAKKNNPSKKCGMTNDSKLVGTLANDFFADGSLSLDLARGLFRFDKLSFRHLKDKKYESLEFEMFKTENYGNFPVVTISLDNGEKKKMLFDTGSASASLVISLKSDWLKLVGLKKIEEVEPVFVPRFGQLVPCYRAPVGKSISLGNIKFSSNTIAVYCNDPRGGPVEGNPIFGVIGLAPFSENVITLDYVSKKILIETAESVTLGSEVTQ